MRWSNGLRDRHYATKGGVGGTKKLFRKGAHRRGLYSAFRAFIAISFRPSAPSFTPARGKGRGLKDRPPSARQRDCAAHAGRRARGGEGSWEL